MYAVLGNYISGVRRRRNVVTCKTRLAPTLAKKIKIANNNSTNIVHAYANYSVFSEFYHARHVRI